MTRNQHLTRRGEVRRLRPSPAAFAAAAAIYDPALLLHLQAIRGRVDAPKGRSHEDPDHQRVSAISAVASPSLP
jgi:hypothetical protein